MFSSLLTALLLVQGGTFTLTSPDLPNGKPLPNATLRLLRDGNRYRYKQGEEALKSNDKGEFTVKWTEPGRYLIGANFGDRPAPGQPQGTREAPLQRASLSATFEVLPK